tara:strand:- start:1799 stop:2029 length:231 start_codon:yes stop_codon:yes gene_type:complete
MSPKPNEGRPSNRRKADSFRCHSDAIPMLIIMPMLILMVMPSDTGREQQRRCILRDHEGEGDIPISARFSDLGNHS